MGWRALTCMLLFAFSSDWQVYRDDADGYTVEYPADWTVERTSEDDSGVVLTHFNSPSGRVGITIGTGGAGGSADGLCTPAIVSDIQTQTCQDIATFSVWTTIVSRERAYTVSTSAKNFDVHAYEHVLESFRLLSP